MNTTLSTSSSPTTFSSPKFSKTFTSNSFSPFFSNNLVPCSSKPIHFQLLPCKRGFQTIVVRCNNSLLPGGPSSGDGDSSSKSVLDAFFLGKAVAEAINERIESTVGEFLSTVGRLQAEQQKQVQDFQEDVLERAKRAKEKAAREASEAQGLVSKSVSQTEVVVPATSGTSNLYIDPVTSFESTDTSETYGDNTIGGDPGSEPAKGEDPSLSS